MSEFSRTIIGMDKWKFWKKSPSKPLDWPTDTYMSVKRLLWFYSAAGSMPFREWKSSFTEVDPALESTVQMLVGALQARVYFWLLERRIGVAETEIAKHAFLLLLIQLSDDKESDFPTFRMTEFLLQLIDDAVNAAHKSAQKLGEEAIALPSLDSNAAALTTVATESFMALRLLMLLRDSPNYQPEDDPSIRHDADILAQCLAHGKDAAKEFFTPMIDAITTFDLAQFQHWSWRTKPGAHERHLQRRHNSLLFPAARRTVTTEDVLDARHKDDAELNDLCEQVKALELPERLPPNWSDFLHDIRQKIDGHKARALQLGGDTTQIVAYLNRTRSDMADVWKACMKGNAEALRLYEDAEASVRTYDEIYRGDFGNQLLRDDACIPSDELVPALLSEDAATVSAFYEKLSENGVTGLSSLRFLTVQVVNAAVKEGFDTTSIKTQLDAIG